LEVTSLSPASQVTFGKYSPNQIIAIVRVPGLPNSTDVRPSPLPPSTIRHGTSEPELYARAKQEEEQQRSRLHYQRVHATSYRPPSITQDYQQRQSRSRTGKFMEEKKPGSNFCVQFLFFLFYVDFVLNSKIRFEFCFLVLPSYWVQANINTCVHSSSFCVY
jgi:hypothetical protein